MRNRIILAAAIGVTALSSATGAVAARATQCTAIGICYCAEADFLPAIDANVAKIRRLIAEQKAVGKAIGYMSIPISTVGGSYFGVSIEVAGRTKANVEKRLGTSSTWLLNPGESDFGLPAGANGA